MAISEVLGRRQGGPEQGQKVAEAQRKIKAKKQTSVHRLAGWIVRDLISLGSPLASGASPFVKLAIIVYLAAGRVLFGWFLTGIGLNNVLLQRTLKELTLFGKPEQSLTDPHL